MGKKIQQSVIALILALIAVLLSVASLLPLYSGASSPDGTLLFASVIPLVIGSWYAFKVFADPNEPEDSLGGMFRN